MGLDNGIILKIKDKQKFGDMQSYIKHEDWEAADVYEILYWRKCWNIREIIIDHLHNADWESEYYCNFNIKLFESLIYKLNECYSPEWWKAHNDSIWEFDEVCINHHTRLINAARLLEFLKYKDPESYELSFYDSY